ncbi:MAG: transposase [Spirochaetaceae bacterium]|nr:transposase [Spirochaetaceae bacterium]
MLIVCMDEFSGLSDAVRVIFTETRIQKCIVHMQAKYP